MSEKTFTPGPWHIPTMTTHGKVDELRVYDSKNRLVAFCEANKVAGDALRFERPFNEDKANARLIAVAPDMYEALKAYQQANRLHNDTEGELFDQAEKALSKAE